MADLVVETAFSRFASPGQSLLLPKVLFVVCQLAGIALGLYKCWSMGLLPTETSDWLAWRQPRTVSPHPIKASTHTRLADTVNERCSHSSSHRFIRYAAILGFGPDANGRHTRVDHSTAESLVVEH